MGGRGNKRPMPQQQQHQQEEDDGQSQHQRNMAAANAGGQHKKLADPKTSAAAAELGLKAGDCFEFHKRGSCKRGDGCTYSHDIQVRKQPKPQQQRHQKHKSFPPALLHIKAVPADDNNMTKLNAHFGQFGDIKTISCGKLPSGASDLTSATIEFSTVVEAKEAVADSATKLGNDTMIAVFPISTATAGLARQNSHPKSAKPARRSSAPFISPTLTGAQKRKLQTQADTELKPLLESKAKFTGMVQKLMGRQKAKHAELKLVTDIPQKKAGIELLKKMATTIKLCIDKSQKVNDAIAASKKKAEQRLQDAAAQQAARAAQANSDGVADATEGAAATTAGGTNGPSVADTTVRVVGLPTGESTPLVAKHFQQYGTVQSVEPDSVTGDVLIRFEEADAAGKAVSQAIAYNEAKLTVILNSSVKFAKEGAGEGEGEGDADADDAEDGGAAGGEPAAGTELMYPEDEEDADLDADLRDAGLDAGDEGEVQLDDADDDALDYFEDDEEDL
jgi:hypothetical protein